MGVIDKTKVRRSFAAAATTYDQAAHLQRAVGQALLQTIRPTALQGRVMDLGCGTGFLSGELLAGGWCKASDLLAVDIALSMVAAARDKLVGPYQKPYYLCADAEQLPFADNSIQYIFSNLAVQWCRQLAVAAAEFRRVLCPGGYIHFTTFGPKTLHELKAAWQTVDDYQHVIDFYSEKAIWAILQQAGLTDISVQSQLYINYYPSVKGLLQELKNLGAQTVSARSPHITGKARWQALLTAYHADKHSGLIPASFEIITVRAKA